VLSVIHGILCVLPSAILFDSVACGDCGSEMCFGDNGVCFLSRTSVFILHAILLCITWVMYVTTMDIIASRRGAGGTRAQEVRFWHGLIPVVILGVLCGIAFGLDTSNLHTFTQQEREFHMARSVFSCYMRLRASEEFVLVQLPFLIGGVCVLALVFVTTQHLVRLARSTSKDQDSSMFQSLHQATTKFAPLRTILISGVNALVTLILWIIVSVLSAPEFESFIDEVDLWYKCKIFDYSQTLL
jgi:hypothetical protein